MSRIEKVFQTLDEEFHARLFMKTGWGCHQVWKMYLEAKWAAREKHHLAFTLTDWTFDAAAREREFELQEQLLVEQEAKTKRGER